MKSISIVIPAYNEVENFKRGVLKEVAEFLDKKKYLWEVILVNDGSTDDTLKFLKTFASKNKGFRVLDIPHGGKVAAVTAGVKDAKNEFLLFTDFDQSTPINTIDDVEEHFKKGVDIVIGDRSVSTRGWNLLQKIRSRIFNLLTQIIALPGIKDSQCGFKAFKTKDAKELFSSLHVTQRTQKGGYMGAFDVELLFLARKKKLKIRSIPVEWKYFDSNRLNKVTEPLKMLWDIILVRAYYSYHLIPLVLLMVLIIPSYWDTLKPGYFSMHDDMQMVRQLVMDKCFKDGQIPCRWSEDLGYGYGYPLFNYYPPLPYYVGQIFKASGFSYMDTVKVIIVINFIASALAMYLLAQAFWGRWGGLVSSLLYVYAPYHAVDIYVRGAINEAWALIWLPAVFWGLYKIIETNRWRYIIPTSLFITSLMLSHNPTLMVFAPGAVLWSLFWIIQQRSLKAIPKLIVTALWATGLAAFFTIPVIFEQKYAHVESLIVGYFNYLAHFVSLNQLFIDSKWGFGGSFLGPRDDMSFQVGYIHTVLSLVALLVALLLIRTKFKYSAMIFLVFGMTLFYTFLAHEKSSFIWKVVKPLEYLQFPWRTLTLSIFGTSFLAGSLVYLSEQSKRYQKILIVFLVIVTVFTYQKYFYWQKHIYDIDDNIKFSGETWRLQITSGIFDYLPKDAPLPPAFPPSADGELLSGQLINAEFKNSVQQRYSVEVSKPDDTFQINTYYFPGWRYFINGKEEKSFGKDSLLGRPQFKLGPGKYTLLAKFTNTPIRTVSNLVSAISWLLIMVVLGFVIRYRYAKE